MRSARCPVSRVEPFPYAVMPGLVPGFGACGAARIESGYVTEGGGSQREVSWKLHEYTDILGMVAAQENDAEPRDLCDRRRGGRSGRTDPDRDGSTVDTPHGGREGDGSACWLARHLDQVPDRPRTTRRKRVTRPRSPSLARSRSSRCRFGSIDASTDVAEQGLERDSGDRFKRDVGGTARRGRPSCSRRQRPCPAPAQAAAGKQAAGCAITRSGRFAS